MDFVKNHDKIDGLKPSTSDFKSEFDLFVNDAYFELREQQPKQQHNELLKRLENQWMTMSPFHKKVHF
jgi:hypothetical protein